MKKMLPNIKLIVILRNPVDRAYSNYNYSVKYNKETLSFMKGIELEEERCCKERDNLMTDPDSHITYYHDNSYIKKSIYVDQLEEWFKYYDREQFLILNTEDFHKNPQHTLDQVFDFLNMHTFTLKNPKNLNIGNYKDMDEDMRKFLINYFKPHNQRLYKLLRRSFDWDK